MATPKKGGRKSAAARPGEPTIRIQPEALVAGLRKLVREEVAHEVAREHARSEAKADTGPTNHPPRIQGTSAREADPKPDGALQVASRRVCALEHDVNLIRCTVQSALSRIHGSNGQSLGSDGPRAGEKGSMLTELFTSIDNLGMQVAALTQEVNDLVNPL